MSQTLLERLPGEELVRLRGSTDCSIPLLDKCGGFKGKLDIQRL
jgi:hypothetical protein